MPLNSDHYLDYLNNYELVAELGVSLVGSISEMYSRALVVAHSCDRIHSQ